MSHPPTAGRGVGPGTESETTLTDEIDIEHLLGTLEDSDCRAIIEEASDEAYSANELSERCDLPLSTTYRKLDSLTEAGLLKERVRLSSSGQHTSEYILTVEQIALTVDHESGISITIANETDQEPTSSMVAGAD